MVVYLAQQSNLELAGESILRTVQSFFNLRSFGALIVALGIALVAGRIAAAILRRLTRVVSRRADQTTDLNKVNRLRRTETFIVLSIALLRALLVFAAFYFWWVFTHTGSQPTAIIAGSAIISIFAIGALNPIVRDLTYGSVMMAEHWFGVGDYVRFEPFGEGVQGIVDRVTLRSTRVRSISGEVIWVNNQNIQGVRVSPKGIHTMAIDFLVSDLKRGIKLIEEVNQRLPRNPLMLVRNLSVSSKQEVNHDVWHITVLGQIAPGREWLLSEYAVKLAKDIDEKANKRRPILLHDPVARFADPDAEKGFARTIRNAAKKPVKRNLTAATTKKVRRFIN